MNKPGSVNPLRSNALLSGVFLVLGSIGLLLIVVCRVYHLFWHPEWTEAQSLLNLYPFYGLALCLLCFSSGWFWREQAK